MTSVIRTLGALYEDRRATILELIADVDAKSVTVPACPEWTIHNLISHLTGIADDVIAGRIDGAATAKWTAAQVDPRRDRSTAEVAAEWDALTPQFAGMIDDFPGWYGPQVIADITEHEHDIRSALDRPGPRDTATCDVAVNFLTSVYLHAGVVALGLGPLDVQAGDRSWIVGTGEAPTDEDTALASAMFSEGNTPAKPCVGKVIVGPFELLRAIGGRRSASQIRSWDWSIDPEPYLPAFGIAHFDVRTPDLVE